MKKLGIYESMNQNRIVARTSFTIPIWNLYRLQYKLNLLRQMGLKYSWQDLINLCIVRLFKSQRNQMHIKPTREYNKAVAKYIILPILWKDKQYHAYWAQAIYRKKSLSFLIHIALIDYLSIICNEILASQNNSTPYFENSINYNRIIYISMHNRLFYGQDIKIEGTKPPPMT